MKRISLPHNSKQNRLLYSVPKQFASDINMDIYRMFTTEYMLPLDVFSKLHLKPNDLSSHVCRLILILLRKKGRQQTKTEKRDFFTFLFFFFSNITVQELEVTSNILVSFQYKYVLIFFLT